jgi:hypothetical protein
MSTARDPKPMDRVHGTNELFFRAIAYEEVPGRPLRNRRKGRVDLPKFLGECVAELPECVVDVDDGGVIHVTINSLNAFIRDPPRVTHLKAPCQVQKPTS